MKQTHLFLAILLVAVGILYLDVRQLRATAFFTAAQNTLVGKTEVIVTNPLDYSFEIVGDGKEAIGACSYYGDEIVNMDGDVPKPYCTWATFRAGGTRANPTMVTAGMVMGAWSADGLISNSQGEGARIMPVANQDWSDNNKKGTDWYICPIFKNEGRVRCMWKFSGYGGLEARHNYAVLNLSYIEPGRRTMAFSATTDVPTGAPAGYIEIELNGQPAYIQAVR